MNDFIEKVGTKKLIIASCVFMGLIVLIICGSLIYNKFFYRKTYSEIEDIMVSATKEYYGKHKSKLPNEAGEVKTIKVSELVSSEYMKQLSEYIKNDEIFCKGSVNVTKVNKKYRYTPILDCGNDYSTVLLSDYIEKNNKVVTSNEGLYSMNNELIYRGENVKNYVSFAGYEWRIVKITDGKVVLIFNEKIKETETTYWDDRYNNDKKDNVGINDYSVSRAREYLNSLYNSNSLFSNNDKLLLSNFNLYVGRRNDNDTDKSGLLEKATIIENQYIGLLPAYDFMNASLDNNCTSTASLSCSNYNYLNTYDWNWWTMTGDSNSSYKVYRGSNYDSIYLSNTNSNAYFRPVIYLVKDAVYVSGNGSKSKPYKFK